MNKVYKHIWSETLGQPVVVSECAKGAKGKKKNTLASTLIAGTALLGAPAFADSALPGGGEIVSGSGSIDQSGNTMTVTQSSQRMIANWQDFSIGADASVTFHQPGADAVALNRVIGSDPSQILGNLDANGQVFLINPNGVVFGQGAQVQTGGFVASTLDMADGDFLAGNYHFSGSGGEILNRGDLSGAVVALIAPSVINEGSITGDTALAAGTDITLDFDGDGLISVEVQASTLETLVDNRGLIRADGGTAILTAKGASEALKGMVNNSGTVQAQTLENRNGRILLLGDMENGVVNAAGSLEADFVETSAATVNLDADLKVDTRGGEWLIDPTDMVIDDATAIETGLASGDVTVSTAGAGSDEGNILISDNIDWSANILILTADNNITINAELTSTGATASDGLILNYAQTTSTGTYTFNAPVNLAAGSLFQTDNNGTVTTYTVITELGTENSSADGTLQGIAGDLDGNYVLGADIDAAATAGWNGGAGFSPIGDIDTLFTGRFEGAGHDITNLSINRPDSDAVGLFAAIDLNVGAMVQHLDLNEVDIVGRDFVGALAGANGDVLRYVSSTGRVEGRNVVGGLVGLNKGRPNRSWSEAEVFGNESVGGLLGQNHSFVEQVYASGTVSGNESVGGLVGYDQSGTIQDSYALGAVYGTLYVGGFVGLTSGSITRSYSSGGVNGGEDIPYTGTFIGEARSSSFTDNYHDKETALIFDGSGLSYTTPRLTYEAIRESFYSSEWDFDNVWFMIDGQTRPFLRFEWSAHIGNAHQLQLMAMDLSADYTLANDIDLGAVLNKSQMWGFGGLNVTENGFSPIGNSGERFLGSFDGRGHVISGLTIDRAETQRVGLFGVVGETGLVRNVGLEGGSVAGQAWVGPLAGENHGTVENSYARVDVAGNSIIGGLVGQNSFGGVIGNTYAAGAVTAEGTAIGGLVGYDNGDIIASYYDTQASGQSDEGKGLGLSTEEIKNPLNAIEDGWDFESIWGAPDDGANDGYLVLRGGGRSVYDYYVRLTANGEMSKIYGEENPSLAGINVTGLGVEHVGFDWDAAINAGTDAGAYHFADALDMSFAKGVAGDYYIDYYADASHVNSLTIDKAQLSVTALDAGRVYNGQGYSGGNGFSVDGFVNGDTEAVIDDTGLAWGGDAQGAVNAGSYALSLSGLGAANYEFNYNPGALLIDPAALTVTANNAGKTYDAGAWNGGNGVSYSGFVNGEDASVLDGSLNYGGSAQGAVNAGEYALAASGPTSGNYDISFVDGTLTIDKAPLTVTANSATVTYNGSEQRVGGFTASGFVGGEDESVLDGVTTIGGTGTNAGTYAHTAGGSDENYELSFVAGSMTINKALATVTANSATTTYNGSEQSVGGFSVSGLVGDEDESVLGDVTTNGGAGTNAGAYVHAASGTDENYELTFVDGELTIDKALATVTANSDTVTYNGDEQSIGGFTATGLVGGEDESVLTGVSTNGGIGTNAGTYVHIASGSDENYQLTFVDGALAIDPAVITAVTGITAQDKVFNNKNDVVLDLSTAQFTGMVEGDSLSLASASGRFADINAGDDKLVNISSLVLGGNELGNYVLGTTTSTTTASISKKPASFIANGVTTYNGEIAQPDWSTWVFDPVIGDDNFTLEGELVIGGEAATAIDAGTYEVLPSGLSLQNYELTFLPGELHILPRPISVGSDGITAEGKTYDGTTLADLNLDNLEVIQLPGLGGKDGLIEGDDVSFSGTGQFADADAGTGKNVTVTADDLLLSGADAHNYFVYGFVGDEAVSDELTLSADIDKAPLTVTANDIGKIYDGQTFAGGYSVSYSGFVNNESASVLTGELAFGGEATGAVDAGSYELSAGGLDAGNYAITYENGTLTIDRALVTLSSVDAYDKIYDGTLAADLDLEQALFDSLFGDDELNLVSASGTFENKNAGTGKTVTISGLTLGGADANNYILANDSLTSTADIERATITAVTGITAADKTYDGTTAAIVDTSGAGLAGMIAGDDLGISNATGSFEDKNAGTRKTVSISELALTGEDAGNYLLASASTATTADIHKAALTVTAGSARKTYDGLAFNGGAGVGYSGFVNGESESVLSGDIVYGGSSQGAVNAGNYDISASGLTSENYDITYTDGALTVDKAALTITAKDAQKNYDGQGFYGGNGASYSGFVNGETAAVLDGDLAYDGDSQGAVNAGNYIISASGLVSGNYDIAYVDGALTVDRAALTVTAKDSRKVYDGQGFSGGNGASYAGFVNGETAAVLDGDLVYGGDSQNAVDAGSYAISVSGLASGNYDIAYADGTLAVDRATIAAVTGITAQDKVYDGTTTATLNTGEAAFTGMVAGDALTVATAAGTFENKNAGTGKTVAISGLSLGGEDANNYILAGSTATATADIDRATITSITGITAADKTYDGTAAATLDTSGARFSGAVAGDRLDLAGATGTFEDKNAGAGKAVSISDLQLAGADAANYQLASDTAVATADIHKAALTVSTADVRKTYDGTTTADGSAVVVAGQLFGSDSLNGGSFAFADKNAGSDKTVSVSDVIVDDGNDGGNYAVTYVENTSSIIDKASISAVTGITAADKTYDGTTAAVLDISGAGLTGMIAGDDLGIANASGAFGDKNAGNGKTVIISGLALTGADAGNYLLASTSTATTADIHKAALTVTANNDGKTYDGRAYTGGNGISYSGFVAGEDESVLSGTLSFGGSSQGAVNAGSYTIAASGLASENYDIAYTEGTLTVGRAALTLSTANVRKTYDGTTTADGSAVVVAGELFRSDSLSGGSFAFAGKNAGSGKTVTVSDVIVDDGNNGGNYTVTYVDNTNGTIDKATIAAVTGITAMDKLYDGSSAADLDTGNAAFSGMVTGDELAVATARGSFDDPAPGLDKNVSITGIALDGADAGNYVLLDSTAEASATVTDSRIAPLLPGQIAPAGITETDRSGVEMLADNRELLTIPTETENYIAECNRENWRNCNY